MIRVLLSASLMLALAGCGEQHEDLRQFVEEAGKDLRGKVSPLPEVKPYEPFAYSAHDLEDPFKPRKLSSKGGGGPAPDLNRPKEPLESYALEALKMVGSLQRDKATYAVVRTPDRNYYRVKAGNYMGQDFGLITRVTDGEIHVKEIVQDSAGDWTERESVIQLQEEQERKK